MKALMHRDARIIDDTSTAGLLAVMREKMPDLVVAGGKTKFLALKTRTPFLDINHGRAHPYAGYEGMVTFARQLDLTVNNPIWPALAARAPWERTAAEREASRAAAAGHAEALLAEDLSASRVKVPAKAATVNPQKNSPALGATLAYLGVDRMLGAPPRRAGLLHVHPPPALPALQGVDRPQLDRDERGRRDLRRLGKSQVRDRPRHREVPARRRRRHDLRPDRDDGRRRPERHRPVPEGAPRARRRPDRLGLDPRLLRLARGGLRRRGGGDRRGDPGGRGPPSPAR